MSTKKYLKAKPGNPIAPKNVSEPEAKLVPTEYPISPEMVALGAWVDAEESRIVEESNRIEKTIVDYQNGLKALLETRGNLQFQTQMVAATRHAREDSLRKLHGVGENFRIVGDKLTCV